MLYDDAAHWGAHCTLVRLAPAHRGLPEDWELGELESWLEAMELSEHEHQLSVLGLQKAVRDAIQLALLEETL